MAIIADQKNALAPILSPAQKTKNQGETYLKIQLDRQTSALIAMSQAQEVILLPAHRLTAIPNMPPYVLGLINRRSRVIWVIHLAQMLGLNETLTHGQQYHVVVIRDGSISLGVVVQNVAGVIRIAPENIQSAQGQILKAFGPYLRGCTLLEKEIFLVLDAPGIVRNLPPS